MLKGLKSERRAGSEPEFGLRVACAAIDQLDQAEGITDPDPARESFSPGRGSFLRRIFQHCFIHLIRFPCDLPTGKRYCKRHAKHEHAGFA